MRAMAAVMMKARRTCKLCQSNRYLGYKMMWSYTCTCDASVGGSGRWCICAIEAHGAGIAVDVGAIASPAVADARCSTNVTVE